MKILHVSDTHGILARLSEKADCVVHSGDLMPNKTRGGPGEAAYQEQWIRRAMPTLVQWMRDTPLLWCAGNHDFFSPIPMMRAAGIDAYDLTNDVVEFGGHRFLGFPYVGYLGGEWNFECHPYQWEQRTVEMGSRIVTESVDVLVSHSPPRNILDEVRGEHVGNPSINPIIESGRLAAVLCGHIHEAAGVERVGWTVISNAACTQRVVEV